MTDIAGIPSGHEDRFEFHNYNSKVIVEKSDSDLGDEPPFATKTKLNAYRKSMKNRLAETQIEDWSNKHPYFVNQPKVSEKPKKSGSRPHTVKQRNEYRVSYFRIKNGLDKHAKGVNVRNSCNYGNSLSLKCIT